MAKVRSPVENRKNPRGLGSPICSTLVKALGMLESLGVCPKDRIVRQMRRRGAAIFMVKPPVDTLQPGTV
jgi:hypothetical protein